MHSSQALDEELGPGKGQLEGRGHGEPGLRIGELPSLLGTGSEIPPLLPGLRVRVEAGLVEGWGLGSYREGVCRRKD